MTKKELFDTIEFFFSKDSYYKKNEISPKILKEWWDYYVNQKHKDDFDSFKIFCFIITFIDERLQ